MDNEKVFQMNFGKVYELLLNKATRKGRTKSEVDEAVCWLTGYSTDELEQARSSHVCYGDFFRNAPALTPTGRSSKALSAGYG
jgi:hypothetical protein